MSTNDNCIRLGIIGCGRNGVGHAQRFSEMEDVEIVAGMDVDPERLQLLKETFPGSKGYSDVEDMLTKEHLDAVCISSIHSAHHIQATAALQHGCHVLLEKPMAIDEAACRELVRTAQESGLILQVDFECRDSALYRRVKEIIEAGELGRLLSMTYTRYRGRWAGKGKSWYCRRDLAGSLSVIETCHYIDLMRYWAEDDVEWVFCSAPSGNIRAEYGYPDTEFVQLKFMNGMVANLTDSHARSADTVSDVSREAYGSTEGAFADPVFGHQLEYTVVGEKKSLWVRMFAKQISVFERQPAQANDMALVRVEDFSQRPLKELIHNTQLQDIAFIDHIRHGRRQAALSPEDALRTHLVSFAIARSIETQEKVAITY